MNKGLGLRAHGSGLSAYGSRLMAVATLLALALHANAAAADHHALVIVGAAGGDSYAAKYEGWQTTLVATLRDRFGYEGSRIVVLAGDAPGATRATGDNVRAAFSRLRARVTRDDVLVVVLIGHGTSDSNEAKFNLVGPDLTVEQWAAMTAQMPGRLVFVNTASGSFPFLERLSGRGRIVVTATDTAAQQFETVFPDYLIRSFTEAAADGDKNGRISVWEAFRYASARVKSGFEEQGRLATERPLLDDNGDGIGREAESAEGQVAESAGADGALARITYLQADPPLPASADPATKKLLTRRAEVASRIDLLRSSKTSMQPADYEAQLEEALVELAMVDRELRGRRSSPGLEP